MRLLLKIAFFCLGFLALTVIAVVLWFRYYSRDLPDIAALGQYAPAGVSQASDPCLGESTAIPYDEIDANLRNALNASGVGENDPSIVAVTYDSFFRESRLHRATLSFQISRTMFCLPQKALTRRIAELRTAAQIERRFSRHDIFTIYANRAYFDKNVIGIQAAAQRFFQRNPRELTISQAALLAGLLQSPSVYSPYKHPDRALKRRNEVIDAMLSNGSITQRDAEEAKAEPLPSSQ